MSDIYRNQFFFLTLPYMSNNNNNNIEEKRDKFVSNVKKIMVLYFRKLT